MLSFLFFSLGVIDCSLFPSVADCEYIISQEIIQEQKEVLLNEQLQEVYTLDHDFVKKWNEQLAKNEKPPNTSLVNGEAIQEAWVAILSIHPSVIEEENIIVNHTGDVILGFDSIVDFSDISFPQDCNTKFSLLKKNNFVQFFVDDVLQEGFSFKIKENSTFKTEYMVDVEYSVEHYRWKKSCRTCRKICSYHSKEEKLESIIAVDEKEVILHNQPRLTKVFFEKKAYGTSRWKVIKNSYSNIEVVFNQSALLLDDFSFSLDFQHYPLAFLSLESHSISTQKELSLSYVNSTLSTADASSCFVTQKDYFSSKTYSCKKTSDGEEEKKEFISVEKKKDVFLEVVLMMFLLKLGGIFYGYLRAK